jgi:hypothetical protein
MIDYFPSKLAFGVQFCNRKKEKAFLEANIAKCRHTVLIAPRRYGKSSLILNVINGLNMPFASVDLFLAHDDKAVTKRILLGVSQAVSQIMPLNQKILSKLQALFGKFRVSLGARSFNIDISYDTSGLDPVDQVFSGLQALSLLVEEQNRKLIFFVDEFQDISEAASSKSIQGAIRHIAQETSNITFIFSGSNRRLLTELFDDKSKPLYLLCDMMPLERMSSNDYFAHLKKLGKKQWGDVLPTMIFDKIMSLTELHPYYVNLLCNELWKMKKMPVIDDVFNAWHACYETHADRLRADLDKLTTKQQDVLKALALHQVTEPTSHQFVSVAKISASSISQIIKALLDKDMIYKVKQIDPSVQNVQLNQLRVLDPLLAYTLKKYE